MLIPFKNCCLEKHGLKNAISIEFRKNGLFHSYTISSNVKDNKLFMAFFTVNTLNIIIYSVRRAICTER
jgi:hypothetical protein